MPSFGHGPTEDPFRTFPRTTGGTSAPHPSAEHAPKAGPAGSHWFARCGRQRQQGDCRCFGHQSRDGGLVASAYFGHGADRSSGIPPTGKAQDAAGRTGSNSAQRSGTSSQGTGTVELPDHGSAQRAISFGGAADLGGQRPQTAPHSNFQALKRSPVRGQILGCHRVVSGSSDPRDRPLL